VKQATDMWFNVQKLIALFCEICQFAFLNYLGFQTMQIIVTMHADTGCHLYKTMLAALVVLDWQLHHV
jgi:hypothetical protein